MLPDLPSRLSRLSVPTGVHNRGLKTLWFGSWKAGKSYALASFPRPVLGIDCGEGGLAQYFPKDDPDCRVISVTSKDDFQAAVDWALKHEDVLQSVLVDPLTALWEDHRDQWQTDLGVEDIRGGHWAKVKKPWKLNLKRLQRAKFHVGYSAWVRETEFTEADAGPGVRGKLSIKPQNVPAVERTVGFVVDMIFEARKVLDELNEPTPKHEIIYWGGRRPASIPPDQLFIGQRWKFDERKPVSVWDTVIAPLLPQWKVGGADLQVDAGLGIDPSMDGVEHQEMNSIVQDEAVGRLLRLIADQTSLAAYREVWPKVQEEMMTLDERRRALVVAAHTEAKERLK